jgi:hypothetical protein
MNRHEAGEVEAPLEVSDCAREMSATEVGEAESEQHDIQGGRMLGCLSDLHRSLSVPDGFIELAALEEHLGKRCLRVRRLDEERSKALGAQLALKRHVPLKQGSRIVELTPDEARQAKNGCRDHLDRGIA